MNNLKRIDPTAIPAIFDRIGLLPRRRIFFGGPLERPGCCLLTAETIDRGDRAADGHANIRRLLILASCDGPVVIGALARDLGYTSEYAAGLVEGWDGNAGRIMGSHPEFLLGIEDGRAAWDACQPLLGKGE